MSELPGRESFTKQVFGKAEVYDFVLAPLAVLGSGLSAYDFAWRHAYARALIVGVAGLIVLSAGLGKAVATFNAKRRTRQVHELEGCLETLRATLTETGVDPVPHLRLTIHKPVDAGQKFEQVLEYVGATRRSKPPQAGRRFPSQSGITGRALRRATTIVADRVNENVDKFVQELVDDWAYTKADARRTNASIYSWLAIPLIEIDGDDRFVIGIVYLDCDRREFFTPERIRLAQAACGGIAQFVARRYNFK